MSDHGNDLSSIGLDLLVNTRKKTQSHDAISILSSGSVKSTDSARMKYVEEPVEFKGKTRHEWMSADDEASSEASSSRSRRVRRVKIVDKIDSDNESVHVKSVKSQNDKTERADEYWTRKPRSESDAIALKREIIYEFERMRSKGYRLPRICTMDTSLEEMQAEYARLKKDRELDAGVMFQRQLLMTCVSGIEFLSTNVSPFDCKLDGWSHHVSDRIDSYDDILEALYAKYKGSHNMAPELRLLMALGGSAVMFSMQNRVASMAESLLRGPTANNNSNTAAPGFGGLFGGLGNMFSNIFNSQETSNRAQQHAGREQASYQAAMPMRGPTLNVDNVLKNLQQNAFDRNSAEMQRVEIISTVSESEVPDDASIMSGSYPLPTVKSKVGRRTLDLDL